MSPAVRMYGLQGCQKDGQTYHVPQQAKKIGRTIDQDVFEHAWLMHEEFATFDLQYEPQGSNFCKQNVVRIALLRFQLGPRVLLHPFHELLLTQRIQAIDP